MAIVEDEVRNESEEENEIEVIVEEDDNDQDSDESDDDDDDDLLERKVAELEHRISEDPYNYDDHIELIQALWGLSELERWRCAFDRLQQLSVLRAEHWLLRLRTEVTLAHTDDSRERIAEMFQQATLDGYSIPILSEWCSWAAGLGEAAAARAQFDEVLRRAGADPAAGVMFWDAKYEMEKAHLETMSESDESYKRQRERVLHCLEEAVSRPLLRARDSWPHFRDLATSASDPDYLNKVQKQHEAAKEYLDQITQFEDKLLIVESVDEKYSVYQEYIDKVKELSRVDKFSECDSDGILKVLYDRASTDCLASPHLHTLLSAYVRHTRGVSSRATLARVLAAATRRAPTRHTFWLLTMQHADNDNHTEQVKTIFETALSKGMESYKEAESLWLGYLEHMRRRTAFDNEDHVDTLRRTFRLAWDSLAESWGEAANDCEVPLFWARLEYRRMADPRRGKEIFEEIFKYGENKTMSKYWEALISLESQRTSISESKLRDLHRRALRFVTDYPPAVARLWTDHERDYGQLATARECAEACEAKLKEWRDSYQAMKDKMTGKQKGKQLANKKTKYDAKKKKKEDEPKNKGKRKHEETQPVTEVKRKRDEEMEVDEKEKESSSGGLKRSHDDDAGDAHTSTDSKRQRTDSGSSGSRAAEREHATLFVSNLEFKVDEQKLRDELSKYGDIVSLRVKAGVKAFGGSICYCQYKTTESVDEALKHDRSPLLGRPMFFSRYSNKKGKHSFKYSTGEEKNKLFVKNLPYSHCTKEELEKIFDKYGKLKDVRVVTFKDGKPKGLAYIEYEDNSSASAALSTHGLVVGGRTLEVVRSAPPARDAPALGQHKRDKGGGMRRTQLSSFIPSVLQRASTSAQATTSTTNTNGSNNSSNGNHEDKRPLSNTDFRNMLLNK